MVRVPPKTFYEDFGAPLVRAENFLTTHPEKIDFGEGAEISTKPISTIFGQKNFFDNFFQLVKSRT